MCIIPEKLLQVQERMDSETLKLKDKTSNAWPNRPLRNRGLQIMHWESPHCAFYVTPTETGIADICTEHNHHVESFVKNLKLSSLHNLVHQHQKEKQTCTSWFLVVGVTNILPVPLILLQENNKAAWAPALPHNKGALWSKTVLFQKHKNPWSPGCPWMCVLWLTINSLEVYSGTSRAFLQRDSLCLTNHKLSFKGIISWVSFLYLASV